MNGSIGALGSQFRSEMSDDHLGLVPGRSLTSSRLTGREKSATSAANEAGIFQCETAKARVLR